ncbi:MAG: M42 family metallopeptidase [Clostridia bacterium]|nr:M42 family metallopeptidase [Clostridia bacterium]
MKMLNYLRELIKIQSVSGSEEKLALYIKGEMEKYFDECEIDPMGNLICHKAGEGKKLLFCAHMDEIGFIVTTVDDKGFVHFAPVGGIDFVAAAYSKVVFENGIRGIMVPEEGLKSDDFKAEKFIVDIGAKDKKQAERLVKTGDTFAVEPSYTRLRGSRICGRPIDDKIACAILMAAAREADKFENDITFVFSVQEEVGIRGSKVAAFRCRPDYGIAIDVTATGDGHGSKPMAVSLGGGAAIKIKDSSVICDGALVKKMEQVADEKSIKWQREVLTFGGTDTASIQMAAAGCKVGAISVPTRYIHTANETIDTNDAQACLELVVALAETKL